MKQSIWSSHISVIDYYYRLINWFVNERLASFHSCQRRFVQVCLRITESSPLWWCFRGGEQPDHMMTVWETFYRGGSSNWWRVRKRSAGMEVNMSNQQNGPVNVRLRIKWVGHVQRKQRNTPPCCHDDIRVSLDMKTSGQCLWKRKWCHNMAFCFLSAIILPTWRRALLTTDQTLTEVTFVSGDSERSTVCRWHRPSSRGGVASRITGSWFWVWCWGRTWRSCGWRR